MASTEGEALQTPMQELSAREEEVDATGDDSPNVKAKSDDEEDLFFPASDDDLSDGSDVKPQPKNNTSRSARSSRTPKSSAPPIDIDNDKPLFLPIASQDSEIVEIAEAPGTSRRSSPPMASSSLAVPSSSTAGPSRKRPTPSRAASSSTSLPRAARLPSSFNGGYLGEFVCEGWSLSKGKGYCTPGSRIIFERPKAKDTAAEERRMAERHDKKAGPAKLVNGKMVHAKGTKAGKQMTIGSMLKKASPAPSAGKKVEKKPVDQIIRFRNDRGFEVGRLSVNEAGFLVHLLDTDIISLKGHVIDCPPVLSTGATILLNVKVYLTRKAFETVDKQERKGEGTFWQEQKETMAEEAMRHRKDALGSLFNRIGIKPLRSNALLLAQKKNGRAEINEKSLGHFSDQKGLNPNVPRTGKRSVSPSKKSTSSDSKDGIGKSARNSDNEDEEAEESGDEAEKLDEEQLGEIDNIYRKAQQGDNKLDETEPPPSFLYTLRPYQKQALTWMNARETGDSSIREESLHPLWEEYAFKKDRAENEPIEIEDDDDYIDPSRKFFWNPYSGELSMTFPTSQTKARGGILADAMGMGKTCMMSSLIHLNQDADIDDPPCTSTQAQAQESEDADEQLAKRPKFKQVTLSNQWRPVIVAPGAAPTKSKARATLVVCPVSLASQWNDELGKMSDKGTITSAVWYGNDRVDVERLLAQEGAKRVDVIVTSYGTLASEFAKWKKNKDKPNYEGGSIYDHEFLRIVLDEAHNIKNRTALVSKACYELKGQRRWALTGTPIVNRLEDLYSLLHFLRLEPWGHYSFFRSFVTIPFLNQDPKALNVVQYILESCLLRREKTMRDRDGKLIVDLPPKTVDLEVLDFSRPERQIYKHLEERAKRRFIQLDAEGRAMSNYTSILAMLMKLRQCVDHPLLVLSKITEEDGADDKLLESDGSSADQVGSLRDMIAKYAGGKSVKSINGTGSGDEPTNGDAHDGDSAYALKVLKEIEDADGTSECMICTSEIFDEVLLPCYHRGCQDCIVNWIGSCEDQNKAALCPMCEKGPVQMSDLRSVQRRRKRVNPITGAYVDGTNHQEGAGDGNTSAVSIGQVDLVSSTKLRALVRRLEAIREKDPLFKALVFSQFTSFLDLIEDTLTKAGIRWLRFDGSMSQAQRAATVESFSKPSKEPLILLISLKAGGVGLNLTMANYVFMMDTWWNEAIEHQAIDRVHRLGQNRPVFVIRYVIKGTVEKRILKIQRSKTALVNASLSGGAQKDKAASLADIKKIFGLDDDDSEEDGL